MGNQRLFRLALRGFDAADVGTIRHVCELTGSRTRRYQPVSDHRYDIILADGDAIRPEGLRKGAPTAWIGGPGAGRPFHMARPILASRLLRLLDRITVNAFNFIPEINIGEKSVNDRSSLVREGALWRFETESVPPAAGAGAPIQEAGHRVLVVDDSPIVQTQVRLILDNLGMACDSALSPGCPWIYEPWEELTMPERVQGGGGTSFIPPIEYLERADQPPDILVYFTDAQGSFPPMEPGFPVIWLVKGRGELPWGQRIQLN